MMLYSRLRAAGTWRLAIAVVVLDLVILAGFAFHLAGATAIGSAASANGGNDPVALLGKDLGETTCATAPLAVGEGTTVICPDWTGVTTPDGMVEVVSLYGPGNAVINTFRGPLPEGVHWGQGLSAIVATLGAPGRITDAYGTPTLVYAYEGEVYGSLELRFSAGNRLMRINASLFR
ncbi:MAG TPA: hypothetical protein VES19_06695 [Candidatus Limnocylindrales bacterium]|nr:hypothetical protein [Candidatus Limnocylindrales bacterium]